MELECAFGVVDCGKCWFLNDFCCWKFKKIPKYQALEGKIVEDMVTLGPMAHATLVVMDCYMPIDEMMSCSINKLWNNNSEVYINIFLSPLN